MTSEEEWADALVSVATHPTVQSTIRLPDGRHVPLDDSPFGASSEDVGLAVRDAIASVVRSAVAEALGSGMPGLPLPDEELAQVRARESAATPGPWHVGIAAAGLHQTRCEIRGSGSCRNVYAGEGADVTAPCAGLSPRNAEFVAHARQDVPALLSHIDHTNAILRDLAQDDAGAAYRLGYEAGRKDGAAASVLRDLEWSGQDGGWGPTCAACKATERRGHHTGCRLAMALGRKTR